MSAFTPVVPRAEEPIEEVEVEVVSVEVVAGEEAMEVEGEDGVTLTTLEGITIRSAEARPESWPKRQRPPSPAGTELGEDSAFEEEYPKVTLTFAGKIEGSCTRAKAQLKTKRRAVRSVVESAMDLNAPEDDARQSPDQHATRSQQRGSVSKQKKRVGG